MHHFFFFFFWAVPTAPSFTSNTTRRGRKEEEKRLYINIYILHTWCYTSAGALCAYILYLFKRRRRRVPPRSNMAELRGTQPHSRLLSSPFCSAAAALVCSSLSASFICFMWQAPRRKKRKKGQHHTQGEKKKETLYIRDLCVSWIFFFSRNIPHFRFVCSAWLEFLL